MIHTTTITNLSKALATFHSLVGKIKKDAKNPFFKSNYASLSNILEEISEPLQGAGLVITQFPDGGNLVTMLIHAESGEYISSEYHMPIAKQNDPQAVGSAISYARRYAITSVLSLNIDDDDANRATGHGAKIELPWLNKGDQLDKAKEYIAKGGSISEIEKKYRLSTETKKELSI